MSTAAWPRPHTERAYIRDDGIVFCREEEEEPFTSDLLGCHLDCLAEPMALEYEWLYLARGKEEADAYLEAIIRSPATLVQKSRYCSPLSLPAHAE